MTEKTKKTEVTSENKILKKFEMTEITIEIINGVPMFELYSTGMALGYVKSNTVKGKTYFQCRKDRVQKILKNADITVLVHDGLTFLNENQLYDFMLEAHTEKCKPFRKWIIEEVLPIVNKTGGYVEPNRVEEFVDSYLGDLSEETKVIVIKEFREKIKQLEEEKKKYKEVYDDLINTEGLYSMNTVSKELNGIGLKTLFKYLRDNHVMFYKDNINIPYQRFMNQGLFKVKETMCPDGKYRSVTYATKKGLEYIRKMLRKDGILSSKLEVISET